MRRVADAMLRAVAEVDQLLAAIAALEAQRTLLGDSAVDASVEALRARLAALSPPEPEQSLRQVTILFLDIVGSTALSQHLDPEETHAVLDGALARCTAIVEAHRGKVLQYAGDNLLAVFGAEQASEDDAERALHCGLALLQEGERLGDAVRERHGHDGFDVRLGAHTGGVLLGGGVDAEGSIRGIAVHIAARMEQTAPAGALRISHDTYRLVHARFVCEPQPPIAVKGVDAPVVSYLVQRPAARRFASTGRGIEGVAPRMIGRDAELAALQQAVEQLFARRELIEAAVVGDAGVGKSRLLHELERWARERQPAPLFLRGRCAPQTQHQPYGLLRDVLARWLKIGDGDSAASARDKIEAGIVALFDDDAALGQAHAHLLGHLIGIDFSDSAHIAGIKDDARQIHLRGFHAAAQLLRRAAGGTHGATPLVLLLEDLHWADDGTLDFLAQLARADRDVPILVLAVARPTLFERRPEADGGLRRRIDLAPLGGDASRLLAAELLKKLSPLPPELEDWVAGRAEGNPFYMEELIKMLVDHGAIAITGDAWTLHADKLPAAKLPTTLTGVLQARLDALPRPERVALQEASVIGPVFWDRALAALDAEAPAALPALERRALALPRLEASFDDAREFAFSHHILHEVTYATLLKRSKRALHARAAAWLAGLTGARANDFLGATAEHYAQAGDAAQAALYFTRAAEHARSRFAHGAALEHVSRGLALLPAPAAGKPASRDSLGLRWRLLLVRNFALTHLGRRAEQRSALDELVQTADALDDDGLRALAARRVSLLGMRTGDIALQEGEARRAMALAGRSGDIESRLEAQRLLADALAVSGRGAEGEALARDGLAQARALGLRRTEGVFLNALSYMANLRDDQVTALELDLQDLPIWRELGDPLGESVALGNVGADWLWFGELERAGPPLRQALKLAQDVGARHVACGPLGNLSQLALWQGDAAQALAWARTGAETAEAVEAPEFLAQTLIRLAEAELALGHAAQAAAAYERAEAVGRDGAGAGIECDALAGRARAALVAGDTATAMRHAAVLLARIESADGLQGADEKAVLFGCHEVLTQAGDPRAADLLARAHDVLGRRAATISDAALRASFLDNVPLHRSILQAWRQTREP